MVTIFHAAANACIFGGKVETMARKAGTLFSQVMSVLATVIAYTCINHTNAFGQQYFHGNGYGNVFGNIAGAMLHNSQVALARNQWNAFDPNIARCIDGSGRTTVPTLIAAGIGPYDGRVSRLIASCQQLIAQQAAEAQQQAARTQAQAEAQAEFQAKERSRQQAQAAEARAERERKQAADAARVVRQEEAARAERANEREAEIARQSRIEAETASEEQIAAQREKVSAMYAQFQTKVVSPGDPIAALLNYSTFGSNSGQADSFWAQKVSGQLVYAEYQKGSSLQEPVETIRELDVTKIDPATFFVSEEGGAVVITVDQKVFAKCQSCRRGEVQLRWLEFFSNRSK